MPENAVAFTSTAQHLAIQVTFPVRFRTDVLISFVMDHAFATVTSSLMINRFGAFESTILVDAGTPTLAISPKRSLITGVTYFTVAIIALREHWVVPEVGPEASWAASRVCPCHSFLSSGGFLHNIQREAFLLTVNIDILFPEHVHKQKVVLHNCLLMLGAPNPVSGLGAETQRGVERRSGRRVLEGK